MVEMLNPSISIADNFQTHIFHINEVGKNEFEPFKQLITNRCRKRRDRDRNREEERKGTTWQLISEGLKEVKSGFIGARSQLI